MRVVRPAVYIRKQEERHAIYRRRQVMLRFLAISRNSPKALQRYGVRLLVHYEQFDTMPEAIVREKKLKVLPSRKDCADQESDNSDWRDRTGEIVAWRD